MAYTSYFSGNSTTKTQPNNSGGNTGAGGKGGYTSYFGTKVQQAPTSDELKASRTKQAQVKAAQPKSAAPPPKASLFSTVKAVAKPIKDAAVDTVKTTGNLASIPYDVGKTIPAALTNNKVAEANATKRADKNISKAVDTARFVPRAGIQVAASVPVPKINPHPSENNVQVTKKAPGIVKTILGKDPIPSLQNVYKTTKQQAGAPTAVGTTAVTAIGDALALKGGVESVTKAANKVDVVTGKDVKVNNLVTHAKTQSLLKAGQAAQPKTIAAKVNQAHVDQGLIKPDLKQTPLKSLAVAADHNQKLDSAKVAQYKKQIKDGEPIEPVVTHTVNGQQFVVKGQHKLEAAKQLGYDQIPTVDKIPGAVPQQAAHPITAAIDAAYKGGKQGPEEAAALQHLRENPEKSMLAYDTRVKQKFGATNVVSGDDAKYVIPGFDSTKSGTFHEPASALAKAKYQQLLGDTTTKDKPVLLMSGGSGAGKTSALKRLGINYDNYAAVIDTNSNKLASAEKRIQQAINSGREVQVFHVHRDPLKSFTQGVIPRGGKEGRIVPIENHLDTHYGSHDAIQQIHAKYKDHPLVDVGGASNDHGHGKAKEMAIDNLPQMTYTRDKLKTLLQKEVDNAHTQGKISTAERDTYHGTNASEANSQLEARPSERPEPQRTTGSSGGEPSTAPAAKVDTPTTRTLRPSETAHMSEIGGYTHSEHMAQDYADMLRSQEQTAKGGQMIPDGQGGYKRTSEHSRFFRDTYKETGRPPTKADYLEEAKKQLESGKDGIGAGDDYKKLLEREAKPVPRVQIESTVRDVPQGTSKVAQRIAKDIKGEYGDLAEYEKINIKDQASRAEKLLTNREQLDKVISGEKPLPSGLRATSIITAVRSDPVLSKDSELLRKLASSPLASESSFSAQELRLARENARHDPVMAIKNLKDVRVKAIEKRTGEGINKAVNNEVKAIRAAKPHLQVKDWNSFVDSIKC